MPRLFQDDLWGGPPVVTEVAEPPARPRRSTLSDTTLDARKRKGESASARERQRVLDEIKSNGALGRTDPELAERLNIPRQTLCWIRKDLKERGEIFYPEVGWNAQRGRATRLLRSGFQVAVASLYADAYPTPRPSMTDQVRRGAA